MEAAICCMNAACGAPAPPGGGWRKGWSLRSGGFANLCDKCGMAYEQLVFCDLFHQKESGWRECFFCGKRLHCGCSVSKSSLDLLDGGGVQCIACMKHSEPILVPSEAIDFLPQRPHMVLALSSRSPKDEKTNEFSTSLAGSSTCGLGSISADHKMDGEAFAKSKFFQFGESIMGNGHNSFFLAKGESSLNGQFGHIKREQIALLSQASFLNRDQGPLTSSQISQRDITKYSLKDGMTSESLVMGGATSHMGLPLPTTIEEGIDQNRTLTIQQLQRARHLLPKPPKTCQFAASEASKEVGPLMRVARPPGEGRGRNQLLPRYWPRITDQELQQISGDSNSTIVPLFEKVLSASDAGRIGRLVLPKACAEAYFPPISQPEGLPLKIQDARGKEWQFQFRFWPNNNSRMYVLEGVTPCIQSLQLQAGDTVTFSRIDPEGKLVMGFRKATNSVSMQDSQVSALANSVLGSETFYSDVNENLEIVSGYSGFLESLKGNADQNMSYLSEHLNLPVMEKKKSRNIGSKSKRLLMDHEDAFELKLKWDEAQDLLRPPPAVKPSIVVIEDYEIEEYEEPPVFGKRTIFTARISGGIDQWIQCDDCSKWRRSPVDVLLPSKWTCTENIWDLQRSSCTAPDELSSKELQNIVHQHSDLKRRKTAASCSQNPQPESPGLDGLAIGDPDNQNQSLPSIATTTRHPRHRPGCTCIVCIQPPSGKGPKHSPACTCNVCLTVKRRFKTLMMRKKKRQSEREEAEASEKKLAWGGNYEKTETEGLESGKDPIDLNCHPGYNVGPSSSGVSLVRLVERASLPLDTYLKQNGLTSLTSEQQASSSEMTAPVAVGESEGRTPDDGNGDDGGFGDKDKA